MYLVFKNSLAAITIACVITITVVVPKANAAISVVDTAGNTVELAAPAQRIIALSPHIVETAFAAGAGGQIKGVIQGSDFPEDARMLPIVGSYQGISLERILELKPDLVLAWGSGSPLALIEKLKQFRIPVYLSEPRQLAQVADDIRNIGQLSGHKKVGDKAANEYLHALETLGELQKTHSEPVKVFYQLQQEPLTTLAGGQIITQAISLCGGTALYHELPSIVAQVNWESLIQEQPDLILAAAKDDRWKGFWQVHKELAAVRNKQLYTLDSDTVSRPGPRLIQGIEQICHAVEQTKQMR